MGLSFVSCLVSFFCCVFRAALTLGKELLCDMIYCNGVLQDKLRDGGIVCKKLEGVVGSVKGFLKANA